MKKSAILIVGILLFQQSFGAEKAIRIQSTPDLEVITSNWIATYRAINPETEIDLVNPWTTGNATDFLAGANLSFVTKAVATKIGDQGWKMVVGNDAIVPIINSKNPKLKKLQKRGITSEELATLYRKPGKNAWGVLYQINDPVMQFQVARFLGSDVGLTYGKTVGSAKELIAAIQKDPHGVGFCRISDLVNQGSDDLAANITLLPIDKNKNGHLDSFENIYGNLNDLSRGVWMGKYPRELSGTIYAVSAKPPATETEKVFLKWVLTEGQLSIYPAKVANEMAATSRQAANLAALTTFASVETPTASSGFLEGRFLGLSTFSFILLILIPFILAFMIGGAVRRHRRQKQAELAKSMNPIPVLLNESSIKAPDGLYYDKSHTWAFMEKDGAVRVGIDDFLQHITGALTRIKMKERGERVKKGDPLFSIIQNGKQLTIHAPISGIITDKNNQLNTDTSIINSSPYTDGWVYVIEPTNWMKEIRFLFMGSIYRDWIKSEFTRFKDFLASSVKGDNVEYAQVVLQDGGELKDGVLADLGPEIWDDFQTSFIDANN